MRNGKPAMLGISATVALVGLFALVYIISERPAYLRADREGVPFFTPQVIHSESGEPIDLAELIRHFKA